ncbi:MAG TPA: hypothetical protein VFF40_13915 [Acidimicrobiia bacterium]|nr:hypothetical protein [Acidimicrobiia bacterium]
MQGEETKIRGRRRHAKLWRALAAAGIATVGVVGTASMAGAARYPDGGEVDSIQVSDPGDPGSSSSVKVAGKTQTRGQLPFTGGDVTALAAVGGGAVVVGGLLVAKSRRHRAASSATV